MPAPDIEAQDHQNQRPKHEEEQHEAADGFHGSKVIVVYEMEEQRRGIGDAVDAVQDSAVARQTCAAVFDMQVSLDRGNCDVTEEAADSDDQPRAKGFDAIEG